jgi:hypothetical protein
MVYGSDTYFKMTRDYPEVGRYLSLGKKVRFCLGGECYNIGEEGVTTSTVTISTVKTTVPETEEEQDVLPQTLIIVSSIVIICAVVLFWSRKLQ